MTYDELTDRQKAEVKQGLMTRLADEGRFIAAMKSWNPERYEGESEERDPSWGEMADAASLVPDSEVKDDGVDYVEEDFSTQDGEDVGVKREVV